MELGSPRLTATEEVPAEVQVKRDTARKKSEERLGECMRTLSYSRTSSSAYMKTASSMAMATPAKSMTMSQSMKSVGSRRDDDEFAVRASCRMPSLATNSLRMSQTMTNNSQAMYAQPNQTMIIFDWDDTLCPSTWLRKNAKFDKGRVQTRLNSKAKKEMQMLADQVINLLFVAQQLGKVIMVTNARRPWVATSCKSFLPTVWPVLQHVPVTYAMESIEEMHADGFDMQGDNVLTETKARAMKVAVSDFYSRYVNQSWKNIVSIGDAFFEHDAIRQVTQERLEKMADGKRCRTKTIKLLEGPTISGIVVQLNIIENWLRKVVQADYDVDIDMGVDEETINGWVTEFGADA